MADRPLTQQPYWTPADQAELQLLTHDAVDAVWKHPQLAGTVLGILLDWRRRRILKSQACWLRLTQELEDVRRQIAQLDAQKNGRAAA